MVLEAQRLTKAYRDVVAVRNVSLALREGSCTAVVGPNGAGKTTLLEMLEGVRRPDSGVTSIFGQVRHMPDRSLLPRIGVGAQAVALPPLLKVKELFELYASLYPQPWCPEELITRVGLEAKANSRISRLSGGQKKRMSVALALIGNPSLLILDEPTGELDPQARRCIWELIKDKNCPSRTVLLATHQMDEAALICDEVIIMDHGEVLDSGSPDYLIRKHCPEYRLSFEMDIHSDPNRFSIPGLITGPNTKPQIIMAEALLSNLEAAHQTVDRLRQKGAAAGANFSLQRMTLDDVFIKLTGRAIKD